VVMARMKGEGVEIKKLLYFSFLLSITLRSKGILWVNSHHGLDCESLNLLFRDFGSRNMFNILLFVSDNLQHVRSYVAWIWRDQPTSPLCIPVYKTGMFLAA
jgi:hypothetical protein